MIGRRICTDYHTRCRWHWSRHILIKTFNTTNTAMTETASEIFGKCRAVKKPWVTADIHCIESMCRTKRTEEEQTWDRGRGKKVQSRKLRRVLGCRTVSRCYDTTYSSKKTCQLVKVLTNTKQGQTNTIHDKNGNCLTEAPRVRKRVDRIPRKTVQPHS